ncbi:hypothetical protein llap_916 [Limosa lapponica baueri]|uniref:Uncharacterized protein n=1 Tax=Limosa lapponica baueri TaxID=1758121 RepID=A0A2I0URU3_LIMLA|nr:hypothetical protein llap_916 [Limosa lapponica baueri]
MLTWNKFDLDGQKQRTVLQYLRMDKDFRYYFQHPWSRLVVAYLVIFFNFLIFAEDPVSHSQTEANVIVVGNCFSFVTNKYPEGGGWRFLKVLLWLLAILTGLITGKFLFHQRLFEEIVTGYFLWPLYYFLQSGNQIAPVNLPLSDLGSQCMLQIEIEKD